jgi:hypothetical protein
MTMVNDRRSRGELAETADLYQHLVRDHGWDENPCLLRQRLREVHRGEHLEADSGVGQLDHAHDGLGA